jgi:hypothetical protein
MRDMPNHIKLPLEIRGCVVLFFFCHFQGIAMFPYLKKIGKSYGVLPDYYCLLNPLSQLGNMNL